MMEADKDTSKNNASPRILVVFDYDWSLINTNSDEYIFDQILPPDKRGYVVSYYRQHMNENISWTDAVNAGLRAVHQTLSSSTVALEKNKEDDAISKIKQGAASVPIQDHMLDAIKYAAKYQKCDLYIVSDANTVFITEMLKYHNIYHLFGNNNGNRIFTNYAKFDDKQTGLLQVTPYHETTGATEPHGCKNCPANMCKGLILQTILKQEQTNDKDSYDHIIYIGDGSGDFCPTLQMKRKSDIILVRKDPVDDERYGLYKKIQKNMSHIHGTIITWDTGEDVFNTFKQYIPSS